MLQVLERRSFERKGCSPKALPQHTRQWAALSDVIKITQLADCQLDAKEGL